MAMAEPGPVRLSNSAARPAVPSRTSSRIKYPRSGPTNQRSNSTIRHSSVNPQTSVETLATPVDVAQLHKVIIQDGSPIKAVNSRLPLGLEPTSPSKMSSSNLSTNRSSSAPMRHPMRAGKVKRWAGLTRTVSDWDGLRRDPELWFEDGDAFVHLYAKGQSLRGASFRVPFKALRQSNCAAMFSLCFVQATPSTDPRRLSNNFNTPVSGANMVELYIPAPEDAHKQASYHWHVTSRNFFAFIFGKPLVGTNLGQTLVECQSRLQLFRSGQVDNHADFLSYADSQGYRDLVDCPEYALAWLYYAEHFKLRDVWIDAFAHVVGMYEDLVNSREFALISPTTRALLTRAALENDIFLSRVQSSLNNFLESDLSSSFLGLSNDGRAHLDRFRTFLHSFYVGKFGYWPPPKGSKFSMALYKSMYYDFKNLYDYLVDSDSTSDLLQQKTLANCGGLCLIQNTKSFDERHNFDPLPHPLCLIPQYEPLKRKINSQTTLRTLTLGSKQAKAQNFVTIRSALIASTNSDETSVPIIQAYRRFEMQCALNQREVNQREGRKIRWLLIYCTLQFLASACRAPKEVRDTEAPYPLCSLVKQSPWQTGQVPSPPKVVSIEGAIDDFLEESGCEVPSQLTTGSPLEPDCQRDSYFFTHTRPDSVEVPAPLNVIRDTSVRSLRRLSMSARTSRRNSLSKPNPQPYCEILIPGYANGLNPITVEPPSGPISRSESVRSSKHSPISISPDADGPNNSRLSSFTSGHSTRQQRPPKIEISRNENHPPDQRTPCFDSFQMDQLVSPVTSVHPEPPSSSNSMTSSMDFWSGASSTSSKSSTNDELLERKNNGVEDSGLLGGFIDSTPVATPKGSPTSKSTSPTTSSRGNEFRFSFKTQNINHIECSPTSITDSSIGLAFSDALAVPRYTTPPNIATQSPKALSSLETIRPQPHQQSISTESFFQFACPKSPMETHRKESGIIDIFSALTMAPHGREVKNDESVGRTDSEDGRSISDALPPPILKAPQNVQKKKERRKSFWRR